jgi:hypothetical protein
MTNKTLMSQPKKIIKSISVKKELLKLLINHNKIIMWNKT